MNENPEYRLVDPELEARIAALVLGEISQSEREQLERWIEQSGELRALKGYFEQVHGLLTEVAEGEFEADVSGDGTADWKLPAEKRKAVLELLGDVPISAEETSKPNAVSATQLSKPGFSLGRLNRAWSLTRIAAVLSGVCFLGLLLIAVFVSQQKEQLWSLATVATTNEMNDAMDRKVTRIQEGFSRDRKRPALVPSSPPTSTPTISGQDWAGTASMPSPYFFSDDEEYIPGEGEFKLAQEATRSAGRSKSMVEVPDGGTISLYGIRRLRQTAEKRESSMVGTTLSYPLTPGPATALGIAGAAEEQEHDFYGKAGSPMDGIDKGLGMGDGTMGGMGGGVMEMQGEDNAANEPETRSNERFARGRFGEVDGDVKTESEVGEVDRLIRGLMPARSPKKIENQSMLSKRFDFNFGDLQSLRDETSASDDAFSTFSLHVSDVSFKLAQAALARGEWPEAAKVRIEEFVNAFDYGDPLPVRGEAVSCQLEQVRHPFLQQRNLLRISMRTAATGRSANTPLRLTFLLDNSGSMERFDRQQTVRRAFSVLADQLQPSDQVTLIGFARQPRLLADKVSGADAGRLVELLDQLPSQGGTNIEAALQLAFEKAKEQQVEGTQNRIILLTDGAVNLGDANPENLSRMVVTMREAGIAFDAAGINAEGLNDEVLEALTRKGDGRYYLLDSQESVDDGFASQIAGALRPSAKNVKVQIEFNPDRVGRYKLLGFENHLLNLEDFRNDKVDAAEMAAAEAGVAVYQFEAKPNGTGDVGSVSVRFRDMTTDQMVENRWPIPYQADPPRPDQATASMRIATTAALFAAKLRGEPLGESVDLRSLAELMSSLSQQDREHHRVQQLQWMIQQARQLSGD